MCALIIVVRHLGSRIVAVHSLLHSDETLGVREELIDFINRLVACNGCAMRRSSSCSRRDDDGSLAHHHVL